MLLRYENFDENNYQIAARDGYPADCYVFYAGKHIATFEGMKHQGDILEISHFAVGGKFKGRKLGQVALYGFAKMLRQQESSIEKIVFKLGRATSDSNMEHLATSRENLFKRIRATIIRVSKPNSKHPVVTAEWTRDKWPSNRTVLWHVLYNVWRPIMRSIW